MKLARRIISKMWPMSPAGKVFLLACALAFIVWQWPLASAPDVAKYNGALVDMSNPATAESGLTAMGALAKSARDSNVRQASAYNFGTGLGQMYGAKSPQEAEGALKQAVRLHPWDEDAKRNLEVLLSWRHPDSEKDEPSAADLRGDSRDLQQDDADASRLPGQRKGAGANEAPEDDY